MDGSPRDRRKPPPPEPPGKAGRGLSLPGPLPGPVLVSEGTGRKRSATARDETGPPGIRTERPAQSQARRKVMSPARGAVCGPPCRLSPGLRGRPREAPSPQDGGPLSSLSRGLTVCVDALGPPGLRASGPPASGPPGLRASGPPGLRASGPQGLRASGPPGLRVCGSWKPGCLGPAGLPACVSTRRTVSGPPCRLPPGLRLPRQLEGSRCRAGHGRGHVGGSRCSAGHGRIRSLMSRDNVTT